MFWKISRYSGNWKISECCEKFPKFLKVFRHSDKLSDNLKSLWMLWRVFWHSVKLPKTIKSPWKLWFLFGICFPAQVRSKGIQITVIFLFFCLKILEKVRSIKYEVWSRKYEAEQTSLLPWEVSIRSEIISEVRVLIIYQHSRNKFY